MNSESFGSVFIHFVHRIKARGGIGIKMPVKSLEFGIALSSPKMYNFLVVIIQPYN